MKVRLVSVFVALVTAGCVTTQEIPLAPNIVRIDTQGSGLISVQGVAGTTMKKAAQATIDAGYTHLRLDQVQASQGSQVSGLIGTDNGNGISTLTAIHRPFAEEGVTVTMFHADEPGAQGAFVAEDVLRKYQ